MKVSAVVRTSIVCLSVALLLASACKSEKAAEPESQPATEEASASAEVDDKSEEAADKAADKEPEAPKDGEKKAQLPDDLPAGESGTYGGEFTIEDEPTSLASALETAESGQTYKVSARVEKVCKKKGCWFTLTDKGVAQPVRVKMKDYGFFVPRNTDGARAIVEGTLSHNTIPQAEEQHYADDEVAGTDEEPRKVEGDQKKWEMMITAARLEMPAEKASAEN